MPYKITTGQERGTYIQIGQDLSKYVAEPADMDLEVLPSKGSAENVQRMRYEPGVKFALDQRGADRQRHGAIGGDAVSAMFGEPIPEANEQHYNNEDSLAKLIVRKIDVAVIVAGQPAKLFQDMNPELLQQIKLLRLDPNAPETARAK